MQAMTMQDYHEECGDGYKNEFQRAAAVSSMELANDDRAKIADLVAQGLTVAVRYAPRYCRMTDAIIGETAHIVAFGDTSEAVHAEMCHKMDQNGFDDECRYVLLPLNTLPSVPTVAPAEDEVPF